MRHQENASGPPPAGAGEHGLMLVDDPADVSVQLGPQLRAASAAGAPLHLALSGVMARTTTEALAEASTELGAAPDPEEAPAAVLARSMATAQRFAALPPERRAWFVHQAPVMAESAWWEWERTEAAVNLVLREVHQVCVYERDMLTPWMEDALRSTHAWLVDAGGWSPNPDYEEPAQLLHRLSEEPLPAENTPPAVELADPSPRRLRSVLRDLATAAVLDTDQIDAVVHAADELLTNALRHGEPPLLIRIWANEGQLRMTLTERGAGPAHPLAGLAPLGTTDTSGLWLAHCLADVRHGRTADGFTTRLSVGRR